MSVLRLIFLFKIFLIASKFMLISGCGMTTHTEISYRALNLLDDSLSKMGINYKKIISDNLSYFQAGSPFPDWGYACGYSDAAENAHWPPFIHTYITYILEKYADDEVRRNQMIAFLFGIESHGISDIVWHWGRKDRNTDDQGFLHSMGHMTSDCKDNWNHCHNRGDRGGDVYLAFRGDLKWSNQKWRVPIKDLQEMYESISVPSDTTTMTQCAIIMYLGVKLEPIASFYLLSEDEKNAAFLSEELDLWYHGGLDDLAANVEWQWKNLISLIEDREGQLKYSDNLKNFRTKVRSDIKKQLFSRIISNDNFHIYQEILGIESKNDSSNGDLVLTFNEFNLKEAVVKIGDMLIKNKIITPFWKKQTFFNIGYSSFLNYLNEDQSLVRKFSSNIPFSYFGKSVTYGDFDGDGVREIAIGAPGYLKARGAVYVFKSNLEIDLNYSDPLLTGLSEYSRFGFSLTTADLNHDGIDDLVISAPIYGTNGPSSSIEEYYPKDYQGRVYVYYGRKGLGIAKNATPDVEINIDNEFELFFNLGFHLQSGDCNNDGYADLIIGSPYSQRNGDKRGHVALFLSTQNKDKLRVEEADLKAYGTENYEELGYSLACKDNILYIGAPGARYNLSRSNQASGVVYVVDIPNKSLKHTIRSDKAQARFGASLDVSSNFLVVGAPSYDVKKTKFNFHNGVVFIYKIDKMEKDEISMNDYEVRIECRQERARFGKNVRFMDNKLIISAPQYTKNINNVEIGRVYVFDNFTKLSGDVNLNKADKIIEGYSNSGRLGDSIAFDSNDTTRIILSAPYTTKSDLAGEILVSSLN